MDIISAFLDSLRSSSYDAMTDDELYDLVLKSHYSVILSNCVLLLNKIINFEDRGGDRLQDKGFEGLRQREERGVRHLRRDVEKKCEEFLRSLRTAGAPFQVENGGKGVFTSLGLSNTLLSLGPSAHHSGLQYNLRLGLRKLVLVLNGAHTFRGQGVYGIDRNELARAFKTGADCIEWALAEHATSRRGLVPEEEIAISNQLGSLTINSSPPQTTHIHRHRVSQPTTPPGPPPAYGQPLLLASPRRSASLTASSPSQNAAWSPPRAAQFGFTSPISSPQAASSFQSLRKPCSKCRRIGHSYATCPEVKCYQCECPSTDGNCISTGG